MGGGGGRPELRLALSDRFVAVLSTPLVEQPGRTPSTEVLRVRYRVSSFVFHTIAVLNELLHEHAVYSY